MHCIAFKLGGKISIKLDALKYVTFIWWFSFIKLGILSKGTFQRHFSHSFSNKWITCQFGGYKVNKQNDVPCTQLWLHVINLQMSAWCFNVFTGRPAGNQSWKFKMHSINPSWWSMDHVVFVVVDQMLISLWVSSSCKHLFVNCLWKTPRLKFSTS